MKKVLVLLLTVLSLNSCLVGRYMCKYALLPEEHGNDIEGDHAKAESRYPGVIAWYDGLHDAGVFRDTSLVGEGGYKLHAVFAPAANPAHAQGTAVVVHGYTDNHLCFLNLVRMQVYDSLLFHRVIKDFMIQGGDLNSKHALPGQRLGSGELDYTIEPEFRLPQLYHRRGVVAAAREPDNVNPEQRSGACQFYIVWGKILNDKQLAFTQQRLDSATHGQVKLTPEMIDTYKTVGGTPHLDGQYTVFGEVTQGLDVVDKIQQAATDRYNRPTADIRILHATIISNPFAPKPQPTKAVKGKAKQAPAPQQSADSPATENK